MFSRARWRLTLSFAGVLALIIVLIGVAVLYTGRRLLFDQVNDDLTARAERESRPLAERLLQRARDGGQLSGIDIGPAFTAGGYFYALTSANGNVIGSTSNADPAALADQTSINETLTGGPSFVDSESSEGEQLRLYLLPVGSRQQARFVLQVGRSTEPEREALRRLTLVLAAGGVAGVVLALGAGFWLAGRALRPIQTAMDRQQAFVADASHELRTPLALIRANAEVLQRGRDAPVSANIASVDDIIGETDRLSGLVGQMLTLARADADEAAFQMAPVDLHSLAEDAAREMRLLAEPRGIALEVESTAPAHVRGDDTRLRELITILLDNAIKHSDEGAGPVSVQIDRSGTEATLRVRDSGRGIPPDALPHLFDRFYRADKARSRDMGGIGLGLAIAKWIVEAHKGTIAIESNPGNGTTVTVELPVGSS
jgi:two-component system, OmpR family, sensor histidine kinase CiaH